MKKKVYFLLIHILSVAGFLFLVNWSLKQVGVVDRKYTVKIGERVSVGFSDVADYIEIYNYEAEPFLYKAVALFVDDEIANITKLQSAPDQDKKVELFFDTYIDQKVITVVHRNSDGIPSYRFIRDEDGRPTKEYLSEIIWSTDPVEAREDGSFDAVNP